MKRTLSITAGWLWLCLIVGAQIHPGAFSRLVDQPWPADTFQRTGAMGVTSVGGYPWNGNTFGINNGQVTNAPSYGTNVIVNGTFDSDTSWIKGTGWTIDGGTANFTNATGNYFYQSVGVPSYWYYEKWDLVNRIAGNFQFLPNGDIQTIVNTYIVTVRDTRIDDKVGLYAYNNSTGSVDNIVINRLNLTNLFCTVTLPSSSAVIKANLVRGTTRFQLGVVGNLDTSSCTNFLICYYDGNTTVSIDACVNGLYTNISTATITYVDGAPLALAVDNTLRTAQMFYNNVPVGKVAQNIWSGFANYKAGGMFDTWTNSSITNFSASPLTYYVQDSFARANGAIGGSWNGGTWGVLSGTATNGPLLGNELLLNPGLEAPYLAGGNATNWSKSATGTFSEETTIIHTAVAPYPQGTASQKFVGANANDVVYQYVTTALPNFYVFNGWFYHPTGDAGSLFGQATYNSGISVFGGYITANSTWTNICVTSRRLNQSGGFLMTQIGATSATGYIDDCSLKQLNLTNLFLTQPTSVNANHQVKFNRGATGFQIGLVGNLDTSTYTNFWVGYYDGNATANLDSCVNGIYTNQITGAITYVDGAQLEVRASPTTGRYSLWYNGAQVSTDKTSGMWTGFTNAAFTASGPFQSWTNGTVRFYSASAYAP
jgi:hypothetical protein